MIWTPGRAPGRHTRVDGESEATDWTTALVLPGPERDEALRRLHALMVRAARHQVWRMRGMLEGHGAEVLDELANSAADEALTLLLGKLGTFEGRSRFTTWAYKFAILQAATEVRRQAWAGRAVSLEDVDSWVDSAPGPELHAEAADLVAAVEQAMRVVLTPYQRKIATALLVDQVPIDVLADRLGTTRGALYKALHEIRVRLRRSLRETGHLPPNEPREERP
ncbi:MAG TPA: sigma-70 family RNA polymerase sigma factor [Intrasporangium sp.]|uniref:sigma-70 family RNA polymerase sigma factor n=1 Tax=Intrasporangium sp. TaxID=1925024 RepID=UPI002D79A59B|nr:sigma-70 family RNA polymerase sigma factor [Intrasporangium sp.]HET7398604.1 sigma-70 family RNA polymerase sigma factor [Intrasporangium sp.]